MVYENHPHVMSPSCPLGQTTRWAVPFANRSRLLRVDILQLTGAPGAFTVQFYNRGVAIPSNPLSFLYTMTDIINSTAPGQLRFFFKDVDVYFFNHDDQPDHYGGIGPNRTIYIDITPAGSGGAATYAMILSAEPASL